MTELGTMPYRLAFLWFAKRVAIFAAVVLTVLPLEVRATTIIRGETTSLSTLFPMVDSAIPTVPYWYLAIQQPTNSNITITGTSPQTAYHGGEPLSFYFFDQGVDPYYGGTSWAPISSGAVKVSQDYTGSSLSLYVILQNAVVGPEQPFCGYPVGCFGRYNILVGSATFPVSDAPPPQPDPIINKLFHQERADALTILSGVATSISLSSALAKGPQEFLKELLGELSAHLASTGDVLGWVTVLTLAVAAFGAIASGGLMAMALASIAIVGAFAGWMATSHQQLADDPPDPNFSAIYEYSNIESELDFGIGEEANDRFSSLLSSFIRAGEAAHGSIVSLERFQGAVEAGDQEKAALQREAFDMFYADLGEAESAAGRELALLTRFLQDRGLQDFGVSGEPQMTLYGFLNESASTLQGSHTVAEPVSLSLILSAFFVSMLLGAIRRIRKIATWTPAAVRGQFRGFTDCLPEPLRFPVPT